MKKLLETAPEPRKACLIGVRDAKTGREEAKSLLDELTGLARAVGVKVLSGEIAVVREQGSQYGMGTGKAGEIAERARDMGADCLIFDQDLSPSRQRNWEKLTGISALDRRELIIQIFSSRAGTREAELQSALARLRYSLPRLSHKYIDLSRQRGGRYGTRGSGETKLETDKRLVERQIHKLESELEVVRRRRDTQRKKREKNAVLSCALVGYTNAGKSSLLNALTNASVFVEDALFATLDSTTRRLVTARGLSLLLTDTVGFIRRLPHDLVESFRSTLEESVLADILIIVLDASDPNTEYQYRTVLEVLDSLGAAGKPMLIALNKADRASASDLEILENRYPSSVAVSALKKKGLEALLRRIENMAEEISAWGGAASPQVSLPWTSQS
ncbi:MAG: GTPase HflX [Spirochaetaceae bacterium]|jgi:GTP-binding protein HflX|nr:GTPase HflX [Spirochaetaceae bacterium]